MTRERIEAEAARKYPIWKGCCTRDRQRLEGLRVAYVERKLKELANGAEQVHLNSEQTR